MKAVIMQAAGSVDDYTYFDHDADIGVVGRGASLEAAFVSAARATFALVTDIEAVRAVEHVAFDFEEGDIEIALVRWLNLLLGHAADRGLALGRFAMRRDGNLWRGEAWGERWRRELERGTDVKGATLTALGVSREEGGWIARCVVDV
jgi:SHS2 domain-containing protein